MFLRVEGEAPNGQGLPPTSQAGAMRRRAPRDEGDGAVMRRDDKPWHAVPYIGAREVRPASLRCTSPDASISFVSHAHIA
jgi:hypothetical protein